MPKTIMAKWRKAVLLTAFGSLLALLASGLVHADFEAMKRVLVIGVAVALGLFIVAAVFGASRRLRAAYPFVSALAITVALSVPFTFVMSPVVFRFDLWRAQRFVEAKLAPQFESHRAQTGRYPKELRLWESAPVDAPWLIRRFNYWSDGQEYGLAVMNPGVCGHVVSYDSATKAWKEEHDPCWY
jgi:hypothetical protein